MVTSAYFVDTTMTSSASTVDDEDEDEEDDDDDDDDEEENEDVGKDELECGAHRFVGGGSEEADGKCDTRAGSTD